MMSRGGRSDTTYNEIGAYGKVYKGFMKRTGKFIAVKHVEFRPLEGESSRLR